MADLGTSISDGIKKSREQNPKPEDDEARKSAWADRIKKILRYNKPVDKEE